MPTATATKPAFRARWIGAAIPPDAPGDRKLRVHSVYARAINLELDGWDLLATITGSGGEGLPQAIALDTETDFRGWELKRGDAGSLDEGSLRLRGRVASIEIELLGSMRELPEESARIAVLGPAFDAAVARLEKEQSIRRCDLRICALLLGEAGVGAMSERLTASAQTLAVASTGGGDLRASIRRLVGLGPGLTPAGDDFLCGFIAAASCYNRELAAAIGEAVEECILATNEISGSLLRCAVRGLFPRDLRRVATAIATEDRSEADRAIRRLCALGHSSGADTASGFLFGLFVCIHSTLTEF
jgi:Protein of unknown function (DUF2877)